MIVAYWFRTASRIRGSLVDPAGSWSVLQHRAAQGLSLSQVFKPKRSKESVLLIYIWYLDYLDILISILDISRYLLLFFLSDSILFSEEYLLCQISLNKTAPSGPIWAAAIGWFDPFHLGFAGKICSWAMNPVFKRGPVRAESQTRVDMNRSTWWARPSMTGLTQGKCRN
jgi:hypothetical protein